ncbi:MAG TPA: serine/threonine-protein kinase [Gemmatimonadaceae bacterium]|nr:serine/threonine-protein kinase [Gemmatimonadaceae bacterium]
METPSVNRAATSSEISYAPTTIIAENYRVERELGRGGMATVYLCTDVRTDEKVAVKVLRPELGSAVIIERFLREIAFASELDHPQIPKVLGSGVIDGVPYYVMTYVEGEPLRRLIDREKQLPVADALRIACEIIKPTAYAHKRGIIHRDLKPENIFISDSGVYVLDFGISRAIIESGGDRLTSTGVGMGTPAYMSPEQALGDRDLDVRTDIYSLGCVIYEMIGGIPPFVGPTAQVVISRRFAGNPPPLRELRDGVPETVEYAVERALARSPSDRWSNAEDFGAALNACATGDLRFTTGGQRYWWRRPNRRAAMAVITAGAIAASALAWSANYREPLARGQRAVTDLDFDKAKSEFSRAVSRRSKDARAQLWLAQTMMLSDDSVSRWRPLAVFASDNSDQLSDSEQQTARGMLAFAGDRPTSACNQFQTVAKQEGPKTPLGISANLSYIDCLTRDTTVVPDASSLSGYRYATSAQLIDSLYEAVLQRHQSSPGAYRALVPRLRRILRTNRGWLRLGWSTGAKRSLFLSQPSIAGDTLVYFPSPLTPGAPWHTVDPEGVNNAIDRDRKRMRGFALDWVRAAPNDPAAHETLAEFLELTGELTGGDFSALQEFRVARRIESADGDEFFRQVRLATSEIRVDLRLYQFGTAAALADTVLAWKVPSTLTDVAKDSASDLVVSLAALRGRASNVIEMEQHSAAYYQIFLPTGAPVTLPAALGVDQIKLQYYSAFGGSRDTINAVIARLKKNAVALLPSEKVEPTLDGIFRRWIWLSVPVIGPQAASAELLRNRDAFSRAVIMASTGNKPGTRALLDSVATSRVGLAPAEVTIEVVYPEAWLRAYIGDTATAITSLDNVLRGLPAALPSILAGAPIAASLVRAMAFRAELASKAHDTDTAKKWANAVLQLWGSQDLIVSSTIESVRSLR